MIATGTGLAPFLGFLESRPVGSKNRLYYGCRDPELDFIYQDQIKKFEQDSGLVLKNAYSRVANYPYKYVQDLLKEDVEEIVNLLTQQNAILYICGDRSAMSKDVRKMFLDQVGKDKFKELETNKQIREDLWS